MGMAVRINGPCVKVLEKCVVHNKHSLSVVLGRSPPGKGRPGCWLSLAPGQPGCCVSLEVATLVLKAFLYLQIEGLRQIVLRLSGGESWDSLKGIGKM